MNDGSNEKKFYKWRLIAYEKEDFICFKKAFEHIKVLHIIKNSKAKIITYEEYQNMVKNGEISSTNHWQIEKGQMGIISLTEYRKHTIDWAVALSSLYDFASGWNAHKTFQKGGE